MSTEFIMKFSSSQELSNSYLSSVKRSLSGKVFTSSPVTQRKKQKTRLMKNSFKETVHRPNSSNYHDSDCCKECMECYCVTKQEYEWIECTVCGKWLHEKCSIFSKTCIDCGHNICSKYLEQRTKSTNRYEGGA